MSSKAAASGASIRSRRGASKAGRRGKALTADYVLEYRNHKLAVIEAKAWDEQLTEGVGQAKNYAGKLAIRFAYSTNGQGIYGIDMQTGKEGEVARFPDARGTVEPDLRRGRTSGATGSPRAVPDKSGTWQIRYYQEIAVERVLEAIADEERPHLLTLATGTGKTSIAFQIAWKLFQARWNLSREADRAVRASCFWPTATRWRTRRTTTSTRSAFEDALVRIDRTRSARRAGCRRTPASSSRSSRRS